MGVAMSSASEQVPVCCRAVCFNEHKIRSLVRALPAAREFAQLASQHKALGHSLRLQIVRVLQMEECCVCDLANVLRQPVSTISQHLKVLRQAGLVKARQEGKLIFCSLTDQASCLTPHQRLPATVGV